MEIIYDLIIKLGSIVFIGALFTGLLLYFVITENKKNAEKRETFRKEQKQQATKIKGAIHSIIKKFYTIQRCKNCNDKEFKLIEINVDFTGLRLRCNNCKSKRWTKLESEDAKESLLKHNLDSSDSEFHDRPNHDLVTNAFYQLQRLDVWDNFIIVNADEEKPLEEKSTNQRHSIPKNVQDRVWNRDGGKCVECGSNEKLEFDHIIPHSKGGADTYRNIQLLCEPCNRSKSAKIG